MRKGKFASLAFDQCNEPEDIRRIVLLAATRGYFLTAEDADSLWQHFSDRRSCGWHILPKSDEELMQILEAEIEEREE